MEIACRAAWAMSELPNLQRRRSIGHRRAWDFLAALDRLTDCQLIGRALDPNELVGEELLVEEDDRRPRQHPYGAAEPRPMRLQLQRGEELLDYAADRLATRPIPIAPCDHLAP